MANVKITELTAATALAGTDVLPIVDVGADATKKVSVSDLLRNLPDGTASAPALAFADDQNTGVLSPAANELAFATSGTQRLVIDSSGNLGLGQTSLPATGLGRVLRVKPAIGAAAIFVESTDSAQYFGVFGGTSASDSAAVLYPSAGSLRFGTTSGVGTTGWSEKIRIDSLGNLAIGTSTIGTGSLTIYGSGSRTMYQGSSTGTGDYQGFTTGNNGGVNSFLWNYENGFMQFATNNTERMRIDSSGRVVIGATSTPVQFSVQNASTSLGLEFDTASGFASGPTLRGYYRPGTTYKNLGITGAQVIFGINDVEKARIDSSGRVGIGTSSPTSKLNVEYGALEAATLHELILNANYGTSNNGGGRIGITFSGDPDGTAGAGSKTAGVYGVSTDNTQYTRSMGLVFNTSSLDANAAERMRIDSSGRLLVGTSSFTGEASAVLEGSSAGGTAQAQLWLNRGSTPATDNVLGQIIFGDNNAAGRNGAMIQARADSSWNANDYPTRLAFFTTADNASSPTERMRITSGGNVLFNCTSVPSASVQGFLITGTSSGNTSSSGSSTTAYNHLLFYNGNGIVGSISTSGSATTYSTSSDYRLKENVVDLDGAITRVKQLAPKRFNFIADDTATVDGFIAHEAQAVVPEAVTGTHNEVDDDGNAVMQGIDQSKLVPLLTAALQEAIAKIETLETKVAALEAQ